MEEAQQVPNQNPISSVPPLATYPMTQSAPKSKNPWVFTIVIVVLLGVASYFGYQNYNLKKQLVSQETTPTFSPMQGNPSITTTTPTNWETYTISEVNLQFKLPPSISRFGQLSHSNSPAESGVQHCWSFPKTISLINKAHAGGGPCTITNTFLVAATSSDYSAGRMSGFADISGFSPSAKTYTIGTNKKPIPESQKFDLFSNNKTGIDFLVIEGVGIPYEYPNEVADTPFDDPRVADTLWVGNPGENIVGAILNTGSSKYPAITIQMELSKEHDIQIFRSILSSVKFTK